MLPVYYLGFPKREVLPGWGCPKSLGQDHRPPRAVGTLVPWLEPPLACRKQPGSHLRGRASSGKKWRRRPESNTQIILVGATKGANTEPKVERVSRSQGFTDIVGHPQVRTLRDSGGVCSV